MIRKIALLTAVLGALTAFGATSASALDDNQVRSESLYPVWISSGVYGYQSGQWMVYDVYALPNGQTQRICHPAGKPNQKRAC